MQDKVFSNFNAECLYCRLGTLTQLKVDVFLSPSTNVTTLTFLGLFWITGAMLNLPTSPASSVSTLLLSSEVPNIVLSFLYRFCSITMNKADVLCTIFYHRRRRKISIFSRESDYRDSIVCSYVCHTSLI